jgi:hypothetical protein
VQGNDAAASAVDHAARRPVPDHPGYYTVRVKDNAHCKISTPGPHSSDAFLHEGAGLFFGDRRFGPGELFCHGQQLLGGATPNCLTQEVLKALFVEKARFAGPFSEIVGKFQDYLCHVTSYRKSRLNLVWILPVRALRVDVRTLEILDRT